MTDREREQKHYTEIAEVIDKYGKTDRQFVLYYLLGEYIDDTEKEYDNLPYVEVVKEYALKQLYKRQISAAKEMRTILMYSVW